MSNQKRFKLLKQDEIGTPAFDEAAQDAVGGIFLDTAEINFTYNDATPSISATLIDNSIANARLSNMVEARIKGRAVGAGTGAPQDLTGAEAGLIIVASGGGYPPQLGHAGM